MKLIVVFLLLLKLDIYAQDTIICPIDKFDIPFDRLNDSILTIKIPKTYFNLQSRGRAIASVLVNDSGTIMNAVIRNVRLQDSSGANALLYFNNNQDIKDFSVINRQTVIEKYPDYIRDIITLIYNRINEISFKPQNTIVRENFYSFSILFRVINY